MVPAGAACKHVGMNDSWDGLIDAYWAAADDAQPEEMLARMRGIVAMRPADDPEAIYEWASVHDFLGLECEAIPLYRAALAGGLEGERRPQALIQLASSLRNVGEADAAVELLEDQEADAVTGHAAQAFLALALRDAGRPDEALAVALTALATTLPLYGRSVTTYAAALREPKSGPGSVPGA